VVIITQEDIFMVRDIVREVTTEVVNSAIIASEERMMNRMDEKLGALEVRMDEKLEALEARVDEKLENLEIRMRKVMDEKLHHTENMILQHVDSVQESIYKKMDELEKEIRTFKEYNHIAEMDSEEHKLILKKIAEMEQRLTALEKRKSLRILK
jgi:exonuclease VII large subunit